MRTYFKGACMKNTLVAFTLLSLSTIAAIPACAQTVKPGLWEIQNSMGKGWGKAMAGIEANNKKMMAAMSAEARKEMAAVEAENAGRTRYTDDHIIVKACITKEQVANISKMLPPPQGNCTEQRSPMIAGVMKIDHKCTNPASTGSTTLRLRGDTGFDMEGTSSMTVQGQRHTTNGTTSGKWLGANCGKIEPDTDED